MRLKVLSYNVHKFFNYTRTRYFLSALKEHLQELDLDVVMLQEMRGVQPTRYRDQFTLEPLEHLADEIWDHYIYGKNAVYTSGHHGNAILSRHPFLDWQNFDISNHRYERRSLLVGTADYGGRKIQLGCTHLDLTRRGRTIQQNKIVDILNLEDSGSQPLILGGDFNDWRGYTRVRFQELGMRDIFYPINSDRAYTYPSRLPVFALDKIFYRNAKCVKFAILTDEHWKQLSDHLPIIAEFEFKTKKGVSREEHRSE